MLHAQMIIGFLLLFTVKIKCECQQRSFPSVSVRICAGKCIYQTVQNCVDSESFIGDVTEVSFSFTKVLHFRRGVINNMPHLRSVFATNLGLTRIYPDAFHNTPNIENVKLAMNSIEEIPWGVFSNMSFKEIDLSWNRISFIEQEAFSNMPSLRSLILYQNKLSEYDKDWFKNSPNLEVLVLSYNKISKLWFRSFDTFSKLRRLDLSFNQIVEIGGESFRNVKSLELLDLTRNNLTAIGPDIFPDNLIVEKLRIALNKLSFLSELLLKKGSVQSIVLQPNPWQCPCLDRVLKWANEHNVTILNPVQDDYRIKMNDDIPVCALKLNNSDVCILNYDEEFLSTQGEYFKLVDYWNNIREGSTVEPPNFDKLAIDESFAGLSPL